MTKLLTRKPSARPTFPCPECQVDKADDANRDERGAVIHQPGCHRGAESARRVADLRDRLARCDAEAAHQRAAVEAAVDGTRFRLSDRVLRYLDRVAVPDGLAAKITVGQRTKGGRFVVLDTAEAEVLQALVEAFQTDAAVNGEGIDGLANRNAARFCLAPWADQ